MIKMTNTYEDLIIEYENEIDVHEIKGQSHKGLYIDGYVRIKSELTNTEKTCILAEEIGHYETSIGDILDQRDIRNKKQEIRARRWAHNKLIPLSKIIECFEAGCTNQYEIADHLSITEEFLKEAVGNYCKIHGDHKAYGNYIIYFDPFGVFKSF